jgi:ABC-type bacteriocin/lantibiotic exporter with double-glycine peptidase domain
MGLLAPQKKLILNIFLTSLIFTVLGILGTFYYKFLLDDVVCLGHADKILDSKIQEEFV